MKYKLLLFTLVLSLSLSAQKKKNGNIYIDHPAIQVIENLYSAMNANDTLALSKILADNNNVIVASRTEPEFKHNNIKYIKFDAKTDLLDVNELPTSIDGFVYLPGSINLRPFKGLSLESFQEDLDINVLSVIKVLKTILPNLSNSINASIVFLSTVAVSKGMPFHSSVALSKGAIEGLAKSLAAEFATEE